MEQIVPWARLVALIEPHYPTGKRGRPPIGLERMLRIYFLQQWYTLADVACAHLLLHGEETTASADAGYLGVEKRPEVQKECGAVIWHVAAKRSKVKALPEGPIKALTQELEKLKAQVRAKVEHPFHVVKNLFGFRKVRYRGLAKNTAQLHTLFALANLVLCKGRLLAAIEA